MAYLIGIDEAGYGPNLGPLVIGATVWKTSGQLWDDVFESVSPGITPPGAKTPATWMTVGDSKQLYSSQRGLGPLELAVQTALAPRFPEGTDDLELFRSLSTATWAAHEQLPWYRLAGQSLPVDNEVDDIATQSERFVELLSQAGIELIRLETRMIEPPLFNQLCRLHGNKATVLSEQSLDLMFQLIDELPQAPIYCQCDRHGGRTKYHQLLQERTPDELIEVYGETAQQSVYRWGPQRRRVEVRFSPGGERFWEVAWASMLAKYVRELAMNRFNSFWKIHQPELRPTKGYPVDAQRFREEIAPTQAALQITDGLFWRNR